MFNLPLGILVVLGLVACIVLLYLADRVLLWIERRGWISYRSFNPQISGGLRNVMGTLEEFVQPEVREAKQEQRQRHAAQADADQSDDRG